MITFRIYSIVGTTSESPRASLRPTDIPTDRRPAHFGRSSVLSGTRHEETLLWAVGAGGYHGDRRRGTHRGIGTHRPRPTDSEITRVRERFKDTPPYRDGVGKELGLLPIISPISPPKESARYEKGDSGSACNTAVDAVRRRRCAWKATNVTCSPLLSGEGAVE